MKKQKKFKKVVEWEGSGNLFFLFVYIVCTFFILFGVWYPDKVGKILASLVFIVLMLLLMIEDSDLKSFKRKVYWVEQ